MSKKYYAKKKKKKKKKFLPQLLSNMSEKFNFINRFLLKHNLIEPTNYIAQNIKKFELKWWIVKIITLIQEKFSFFN